METNNTELKMGVYQHIKSGVKYKIIKKARIQINNVWDDAVIYELHESEPNRKENNTYVRTETEFKEKFRFFPKGIEIIKCTKPNGWYRKIIGRRFEILEINEKERYYVVKRGRIINSYVEFDDCIIIK